MQFRHGCRRRHSPGRLRHDQHELTNSWKDPSAAGAASRRS